LNISFLNALRPRRGLTVNAAVATGKLLALPVFAAVALCSL
jgi:hypothetical protein